MRTKAFGVWIVLLFATAMAPVTSYAGSFLPDSVAQALLGCPGYSTVRVAGVIFVGNDITKERTLRAELDFKENDTLNTATLARRIEANRRRIFNLQLFHQVLTEVVCRAGDLTILFSVQERWYTFPVPILSIADRNFRAWADRSDRWRRVDYGVHLTRKNFRGRNEELRGNLQLGFNRKYELFYEAPGYGRRRRVGVGVGISYYKARALDYATVRDQLAPFRPQAGFPVERRYVTAGLRWRRTVRFLAAFDVSYHREAISDSVNFLNPDYYLGRTQREYLDVRLSAVLNQRNTFAYPLTGRYAQAQVLYRRFLTDGAPPQVIVRAQYAHYTALGGPLYYSASAQGQLHFSRRLPYADTRALGYDALVRGYDRYVVDGRHYMLVQQGVSYRVFDGGQVQLQGVPNSKINTIPLVLYLNTFTDAGYVVTPPVVTGNKLPERLLASAGVGLHLVTYYDRVFTLEYTRNIRGQGGFFFRSEFPI